MADVLAFPPADGGKPRVRVQAGTSRTSDSFENLNLRLGMGANPGLGGMSGYGNAMQGAGYTLNPITRNRVLLEYAYRGSWICRNAVDCVADDMTREGIDMVSIERPEDIEIMQRAMKRLGIFKSLSDVSRWSRLYGGALGVILIDGQKLDTPLRPQTVGKGQFRGIMVLDRWLVQPTLEDLVSEMGPGFGLPRYYETVADFAPIPNGRIHYSRVIRLDGADIPFWQRIAENMWNISVLEPLWDRLIAFDSTTQGIAQLAYKAHLRVIRMKDLRANIASGGKKLEAIAKMMEQIRMFQSNEGLTLIDADDEFAAHTYSFGGVSEVMTQFAGQLAGATKIPVVRLFGQSPGGLNATGESDIRFYYDSIRQEQENTLRGPLELLLTLLHYSELGHPPEDGFSFEFSPLWQLKEDEKAAVNTAITAAINQTFEMGLISEQVALKELRQSSRITGIWSNLTDTDIAAAQDKTPLQQNAEMMLGPQAESDYEIRKLEGMPHEDLNPTPAQQSDINALQKQFGVGSKPATPTTPEVPGAPIIAPTPEQQAQIAAFHQEYAQAGQGDVDDGPINLSPEQQADLDALWQEFGVKTRDEAVKGGQAKLPFADSLRQHARTIDALHRQFVRDYDPEQARLPAGTATEGTRHAGEWTAAANTPGGPDLKTGQVVYWQGEKYYVKSVDHETGKAIIELAKPNGGAGVVSGTTVNVDIADLSREATPNEKAIGIAKHGDEWNRKTAERLEKDYAKAKPDLERLAEDALGAHLPPVGEDSDDEHADSFAPESWEMLTDEQQSQIEGNWKTYNHDGYYENESDSWYSEQGPQDSAREVAQNFNAEDERDWAVDALDEYIADREADEEKPLPFSRDELLSALQISGGKYDEFEGGNADFDFDYDALDEIYAKRNPDQLALPGIDATKGSDIFEPVENDVAKVLRAAFEKEAENHLSSMDPPEYLEESVEESLNDMWDQLDDSEKWNFAKDNHEGVWDDPEDNSASSSDDDTDAKLDRLPTKFDPLNETVGDDYRRTQKLARFMSVARAAQLIHSRGLVTDEPISSTETVVRSVDRQIWDAWKSSSSSSYGTLLQVATADELGGRMRNYAGRGQNVDKAKIVADANRSFPRIGGYEGVKAYIRAKWETTQYLLDKAGMQTVRWYRSLDKDLPFMEKGQELIKMDSSGSHGWPYTRLPFMQLHRNGAQSGTTDASVANGWGGGNQIVIRAETPRTAIVSVPAYGINIQTEHEVVVAGTAWGPWDAWRGGAPTFERYPIGKSEHREVTPPPAESKMPELYNPDLKGAQAYAKKSATINPDVVEGPSPDLSSIGPNDSNYDYTAYVKSLASNPAAADHLEVGKAAFTKPHNPGAWTAGQQVVVMSKDVPNMPGFVKVVHPHYADNPEGHEIVMDAGSLQKAYVSKADINEALAPDSLTPALSKFKEGDTVYSKNNINATYKIVNQNGKLWAAYVDPTTGEPDSKGNMSLLSLVHDLLYHDKAEALKAHKDELGEFGVSE